MEGEPLMPKHYHVYVTGLSPASRWYCRIKPVWIFIEIPPIWWDTDEETW